MHVVEYQHVFYRERLTFLYSITEKCTHRVAREEECYRILFVHKFFISAHNLICRSNLYSLVSNHYTLSHPVFLDFFHFSPSLCRYVPFSLFLTSSFTQNAIHFHNDKANVMKTNQNWNEWEMNILLCIQFVSTYTTTEIWIHKRYKQQQASNPKIQT